MAAGAVGSRESIAAATGRWHFADDSARSAARRGLKRSRFGAGQKGFYMKIITCIALAALAASTSVALAAPQSFYGKTLRVTWNETRSLRPQGEGTGFSSQSIAMSYTVYTSSKGQLFKRLTSTRSNSGKGGPRTGSKERVGASGSNAEGGGSTSFQGNTLIHTANNNGLGRRIRITFDGGSSCSAEVLTGKAGSGVVQFRSIATGKMMEMESVSAGSASCSVQDGNGFAD